MWLPACPGSRIQPYLILHPTLYSAAILPHPSHLVLHWILLPPFQILPGRTHPIPSITISTASSTGFFCHATPSYLILPSLTNPTPSYPVCDMR